MHRPALPRWLPGWWSGFGALTAGTLVWISSLIALLWLTASLVAVTAMRHEATQQADLAGGTIATAAEQELGQTVGLVDFALSRVADGLRDPELQRLDPARRNASLFASAAMLPDIAFFEVLDQNGDIIASLKPIEHATNWASRDYFIEHRRDPALGLLVSRPFATSRQDLAGVAFSRRLTRPDGSFDGVVVCGLRLSHVNALLARLSLNPLDTITLYRSDGVALTRWPADANAIGRSLDPGEPLAKAVATGNGQVMLDDPVDHVSRRLIVRGVGTLPLAVAVGLAQAGRESGWSPATIAVVAVGLLLALLTVAMALRLRVEVRRREAMARETAEKTRFLATMSHELRTPLHGLLGYAEQLRNSDDLPASCGPRLDGIFSAGRMLREVIDRLLDYWRLESRGPAPQMAQLDVAALLDECRAVVEPETRAKSLELTLATEPGAPLQFVTDGTWLRQVVLNLLVNAVKFTRHGKVELRYRGTPDRVRIEVADTGPGVPDDQRHRLFQEFERLGADDTGVSGSGLGLSIADRLIRRMGGQIGHDHNPGGGSIFWVDLPAGTLPLLPVPGVPAVAAPDRPLRIMVVDDSDVHRDLARSFLSSAGHTVVTAAAGGKAVELLAEDEDFDIVLMDMSMPVMNGLEVTRQIRALQGRQSAVPIIAVTANALDEEVAQYRRAGLIDYVSKPYTKAELLAAIATAAQRRGPAPAAAARPVAMEGEAPLLDLALLSELETSVGAERMAAHLATLTDDITALLAGLRDPAASGGSELLIERAHIIAGDAGQLGFTALSQAARRLMAALKHDQGSAVLAAVALREIAGKSQTVLLQRVEFLRCALTHSAKLSVDRRTATESTLR